MPSAFSPPAPSPLCRDEDDDGAGICIIEDARLGWTANLRSAASASGLPRARRRRRWLQPSAAVVPPSSCRPHPPRRRQNYSCVGVILVVDGISVVVGIVASSSSSQAALRRPLVLSLPQLVVACNLCRPIVLHRPLVLRRPLVLLSHRMVVACYVASIALSCCAALSSSRRASWLLVVLACRRPLSPYLVAPSSCPLVVPASCCVSRRLCRPIMLCSLLVLSSRLLVVACRSIVLRCPLVLSSHRLVIACRVASVVISSCAALSSSRRAG